MRKITLTLLRRSQTGSQKAASELAQIITEHTPLEAISQPPPLSSTSSQSQSVNSFTSPRDTPHEEDEEDVIGGQLQVKENAVEKKDREREDEEEEVEKEKERVGLEREKDREEEDD